VTASPAVRANTNAPDKGADASQVELEQALLALARSEPMKRLKTAGRWALSLAVTAAATDGFAGELTLTIPAKSTVPVEATFLTGH
jgi:outer membrane protein W